MNENLIYEFNADNKLHYYSYKKKELQIAFDELKKINLFRLSDGLKRKIEAIIKEEKND